jgi:monoamine oxidase
MKDYDICILGAGFAGLYCALECAKQWPDAKIVILEKYNYVGGRAVTFHKIIPGIGPVQWENGAGRIHSSHTWVTNLVKQYGLTLYPIDEGIEWRTSDRSEPIEFRKLLTNVSLKRLRPEVLLNGTIQSILESTLGVQATHTLLDRYEYRSELDTLRADRGIEALDNELGDTSGFFVIKEGFSSLVKAIQADLEKRDVRILTKYEVTNVQRKGNLYTVSIKDHLSIQAAKVVVALHRDAVSKLPSFKDLPILQMVKMRPLVRMYAIFPKETSGSVWFANLKKFICPLPIRFVIPINPESGIIMISYTDGPEAEYWISQIESKGNAGVQTEVMAQIRSLFPTMNISDPSFFKIHPWYEGCSYWVPGPYDFLEESLKSIKPLPETMPGVYMCNESWAYAQCWVKCAIDQADLAFKRMLQDTSVER